MYYYYKSYGIYDPDAAAYFAAVEAADGQPLPESWKIAVNDFIIGNKADASPNSGVSNWDAIKIAGILRGAATLSGALIPLKGVAPTNNNFVSGDYDRSVGLKGANTKYLEVARANDADPQNNKHLAVWRSMSEIRADVNVRAAISSANAVTTAGTSVLLTNSSTRYFRCNYNSDFQLSDTSTVAGYWGVSRTGASAVNGRYAGVTTNSGATSATPVAGGTTQVFARIGANFTDAILAWYSEGEAVDQAALESRLSTLMAAAVLLDTNAAAYSAAVESASGQTLPQTWKDEVARFVVRCKTTRINDTSATTNWDAFGVAVILSGCPNFAGALVPLKGAAPTNNNFTASDYNPQMGLKGGLNKTLTANRANNADGQNSNHMSLYSTSTPIPPTGTGMMGCSSGNLGTTALGSNPTTGNIYTRSRGTTPTPVNTDTGQNLITGGFAGLSRNNSANYDWRVKGNTANVADASNAPDSIADYLFSVVATSIDHPKRISWYSIGGAINLAALEGHVNTLMAAANTLDTDVQAWIRNVDVAGGTLSDSWINSVNDFVVGCKADGTWSKLSEIGLLAGGSNLTTALVKLKAFPGSPTSFTNTNFVSGNYTATGASAGLVGDGTAKILDTGWTASSLTLASSHLGVYNSVAGSTGNRIVVGTYVNGTNCYFLRTVQNGDNSDTSIGKLAGGNNGNRNGYTLGANDSGNLTTYINGVQTTQTTTSGALPAFNVYLGAVNVSGTASNFYNGRMTLYHAGTGLTSADATALSNRVNTLMTSIGANKY